jgi:nucleotidyltransferase/DNA polymerase involved in DNA repair
VTQEADPIDPREKVWVVYLDMDAFYLSCELTRHPELRGSPAIVAHDPKEGKGRGVVLSASYEARALGFRSAQPVKQAWLLRHLVQWLPPDFEFYQAVSDRVMEYLRSHSASLRVFSIDEAAYLTEELSAGEAEQEAKVLQQRIQERFHLPCSLGIATGLTVAKMASDHAKPGGIRIVKEEDARDFLAHLPVRKVPGIGPVAGRALEGLGVKLIEDAAKVPAAKLRSALGQLGLDLREMAEGRVPSEGWPEETPPKSMGQMITFDSDLGDPEPIQAELKTLSEHLGPAIRKSGHLFKGVSVTVRWEDLDGAQKSRTLKLPTDSGEVLRNVGSDLLNELLRSRERAERKVRTLGLSVYNLRPAPVGQRKLEV